MKNFEKHKKELKQTPPPPPQVPKNKGLPPPKKKPPQRKRKTIKDPPPPGMGFKVGDIHPKELKKDTPKTPESKT